MKEAGHGARPGCLFLLSEPTVWQHHILLDILFGAQKEEGHGDEGPVNTNSPEKELQQGAEASSSNFTPHGKVDGTRSSRRRDKFRYWWLDAGEQGGKVCVVNKGGDETMVRNGPGILLLQKLHR
jgi:hypothetical protein